MASKKDKEEFRPSGTMAVLVIFILTVIALWLSIFAIMWQRGLTV